LGDGVFPNLSLSSLSFFFLILRTEGGGRSEKDKEEGRKIRAGAKKAAGPEGRGG
jgi:hypothetical protein